MTLMAIPKSLIIRFGRVYAPIIWSLIRGRNELVAVHIPAYNRDWVAHRGTFEGKVRPRLETLGNKCLDKFRCGCLEKIKVRR